MQDNAPNRNPQVQIDDISKQPIARTMEPKAFEEKTEHLVIGSSIIKHQTKRLASRRPHPFILRIIYHRKDHDTGEV